MQLFESSLVNNLYDDSLYHGLKLLNSVSPSNHKLFWATCYKVIIEYIHITLPDIHSFFYSMYNRYHDMNHHNKEDIEYLIHVLTSTQKQHISVYVNIQEFNKSRISNDPCNYGILRDNLHVFNKCINYQHEKGKLPTTIICNQLYSALGSIFAFDCDTDKNQDKEYGIILYSHLDSKISHKIMDKIIKTITITTSKGNNKQVMKNIASLKYFYHEKLLLYYDRQMYIILNMCYYLMYSIDFDYPPFPSRKREDKVIEKEEDKDKDNNMINNIILKSKHNLLYDFITHEIGQGLESLGSPCPPSPEWKELEIDQTNNRNKRRRHLMIIRDSNDNKQEEEEDEYHDNNQLE